MWPPPSGLCLASVSRGSIGGGGGIRTRDLWVMSPTSCRCSTPRHPVQLPRSHFHPRSGGRGRPRRPRLPQGCPCSTLRRCRGSRPGSGWDRVGPRRSRPRAPPTPQPGMVMLTLRCSVSSPRFRAAHAHTCSLPVRPAWGTEPDVTPRKSLPSFMRTGRLRSVTSRPPPAAQPGRLPGNLPLASGDPRLGR